MNNREITVEDADVLELVYTPISVIKDEISRRWNDKDLRKRVNDFFGENILSVMKDEQRSVLSRSIISPNKELEYFCDISKELGIKPLLLEYDSKFVAKNPDKYHLCNLPFLDLDLDRSAVSTIRNKVVDFNLYEGKYFKEIKTFRGDGIVNFHHDMLKIKDPSFGIEIHEFSNWFNKTRNLSEYYYLYYLSLFVCNGVLFENFMLKDKEEYKFFHKNILPSFKKVTEIFGVKPLIYPLLPIKHEKSHVWMSYDILLKGYVDNLLKK